MAVDGLEWRLMWVGDRIGDAFSPIYNLFHKSNYYDDDFGVDDDDYDWFDPYGWSDFDDESSWYDYDYDYDYDYWFDDYDYVF